MFSYQRTIQNKVGCTGVGLHSGKKVRLSLAPAKEDTGIVFKRTDVVDGRNPFVAANYKNVASTQLGTNLRNEDGVEVGTIEHLMAALWGCSIDNCLIELDNAEVPIMDGSSEPFVFLVECSGKKEQKRTRRVIEIIKEVTVLDEKTGSSMTLSPADEFAVSLDIDFGDKVIAKQSAGFNSRGESFKSDLSRARTFGCAHEVDYLDKKGLALGGSLDNAIVVNENGIANEDGLRYADEFVRHKILDCIGDIFLAGAYVKGHFHGVKSGHALNNKILHAALSDGDAWREVRLPDEQLQRAIFRSIQ